MAHQSRMELAHHNPDVWVRKPLRPEAMIPIRKATLMVASQLAGAALSASMGMNTSSAAIKYLSKTAYPLMKGAAEFLLQWLQNPETGYWITNPSTSPGESLPP